MNTLRQQLPQLSLDQFLRILLVVDEVRQEMGGPCPSMEEMIDIFDAEERAEVDSWRHAAA